jgi:cation diffusion facilitator CzcD-associated flavoprotein CzcO
LETQNTRDTYCLSDLPMPKDYPEWPTSDHVQRYLATYVERFELGAHIRLGTEVVGAEAIADGWELRTTDSDAGATNALHFDYLVVANGIFCYPLIPTFSGVDEYRAAGGRIVHTSDFQDLEDARGKHLVVVGYGKSACDLAAAISDVTASTTVVARELIWKMPKFPGGINVKYLLLTRMGEALFRYIRPRGFERFLHGPGDPLRRAMLAGMQAMVARQLRLKRLGLLPRGPFEDIGRSTVSLATDGFYEKVQAGTIAVRRDAVIERLLVDGGRPSAAISGGEVAPADLIACGTGWEQRVPFFSEELHDKLTDERGNFELYRQIQPLEVPRLSFCGYNSSFFSPLSAEIAALWIANLLMGAAKLPPVEEQRADVQARLRWMEERTRGHHARGTNVIPFSMHNIDEMLEDVGIDVSPATRTLQWLLPINPLAYRKVTTALLERQAELGQDRRPSLPPV